MKDSRSYHEAVATRIEFAIKQTNALTDMGNPLSAAEAAVYRHIAFRDGATGTGCTETAANIAKTLRYTSKVVYRALSALHAHGLIDCRRVSRGKRIWYFRCTDGQCRFPKKPTKPDPSLWESPLRGITRDEYRASQDAKRK